MNQRRRTILFDLDGTLVDSAPDIAAALNDALAGASIPPLDLATVKSYVGSGARLLVERALGSSGQARSRADVDDILKRFLVSYRETPACLTRLYPGMADLLLRLSKEGTALGIATNKPQDLTHAILEALSIRQMFDAVAASLPGLALKPAPDLILKALEELGTATGDAVMLGDSRADLEAARAAGCRIVLVTHGYSGEPVGTLGADAVISDVSELPDLLQRSFWLR